MSDPLDDPVRNLRVGCLWPIARNIMLTAVTLAISIYLGIRFDSWAIGLVVLVVLVTTHEIVRRRYWLPREQAASDRLLGIDRNM